MNIAVLNETSDGEARVALMPDSVTKLVAAKASVSIESNAGLGAARTDEDYAAAGANIVADRKALLADADVLVCVSRPADEDFQRMKQGAVVLGFLRPLDEPAKLTAALEHSLTTFSMELVPRITRAQSMDVLSSMANIAGYRAVIEAAHTFGRFFTGQVTAAGKVPPAKVLVVGAGVAGLAAIGSAGALGAIVKATDPRPEVADQISSLGGEYVSITSPEVEVSTTGYAKEMGEDYKAREAELYAQLCREVDIIITTALIPGRPAPRIITGDMVASMKPGSVVVDMAAQNGGNVEGTVAGQKIVTSNGVTIIGYTDLAGRLAAQASQLYGTNLVNLMKLMTPAKDGQLVLDFDDVVQRSMTVVRDGEKTWPPPPVAVSAAPVAQPSAEVTPKDVGGPGKDALVFGVTDKSAGTPILSAPVPGFPYGIPSANVSGQGGFCTLEAAPASSGYDYLVRFFGRATGNLAVTVRVRDVEQLFCTSVAGGQITYADLTQNPRNPFPISRIHAGQIRDEAFRRSRAEAIYKLPCDIFTV